MDNIGKKVFIGFLVLVVFISAIILAPKSKTLKVEKLFWRNIISFETEVVSKDSGFELPYGATVTWVEQRDDIDGVEKPYYHYTIKKWKVTRTEETSGEKGEELKWGSSECQVGERLGSKVTKYCVLVRNDDLYYDTYTTTYDIWKKLQINEPNRVKVSVNNTIVSLD